MTDPKLIDDRMPDNQLTDLKKRWLWEWLRVHHEDFEQARASYATIAAKATQTLRFRITPKNIEGAYKTLEIPAPCRRREVKPVEDAKDVKAMMQIMANEIARQVRQAPSDAFMGLLKDLDLIGKWTKEEVKECDR